MNLEAGDLFMYQHEYESRRGSARIGLVIDVMGRIHHDIDDICLLVLIGGEVVDEWQSFLLKLP